MRLKTNQLLLSHVSEGLDCWTHVNLLHISSHYGFLWDCARASTSHMLIMIINLLTVNMFFFFMHKCTSSVVCLVYFQTCILAISGVANILSIYISYHLFTDIHSTYTEIWCAGVAVVLTILVLFICLYKEEGIISDAAVVSLVMMFIVWAMKQERLMQEHSLDLPSQWLQQVTDNRSFLKVFLSMAKVSIAHATRVKRIISLFISPTCLLFALVRIASVVGFVTLTPIFIYQEEDDEYSTLHEVDSKPHRKGPRPLYLRLIIIFVYTQVVVRTIDSTTTDRQDRSQVTSLSYLSSVIPGIRVWRIIQLLLVTVTYIYQMFRDEYE